MSDIGVGDWVECVDAGPHKVTGILPVPLIQNAIYQISRVALEGSMDSRPEGSGTWLSNVVWLHGVRATGPYMLSDHPFVLARFRPIYRPKAELIESLKAFNPEKVLA